MRIDQILARLKGACEENKSKHAAGIYLHSSEIIIGTNDPTRTRVMNQNYPALCAECSAIHDFSRRKKGKQRLI
jgi:hypothetical protein